jgi:hypothetical protein
MSSFREACHSQTEPNSVDHHRRRRPPPPPPSQQHPCSLSRPVSSLIVMDQHAQCILIAADDLAQTPSSRGVTPSDLVERNSLVRFRNVIICGEKVRYRPLGRGRTHPAAISTFVPRGRRGARSGIARDLHSAPSAVRRPSLLRPRLLLLIPPPPPPRLVHRRRIHRGWVGGIEQFVRPKRRIHRIPLQFVAESPIYPIPTLNGTVDATRLGSLCNVWNSVLSLLRLDRYRDRRRLSDRRRGP